MHIIENEPFFSCISTRRCRQILALLFDKSMSSSELIQALGKDAPKYQQTINKNLSKLESCNLIRRTYDFKNKHFVYSTIFKEIIIKFENKNLDIELKPKQNDEIYP